MSRTILDRLLEQRRKANGRRFDRSHGIETTGRVSREQLIGMPAELRDCAGEYRPTNPALLRRIVRQSRLDPGLFNFVDLGCGKGRALIAAASYGFNSVLGVEAEEGLFRIARENGVRWRGEDRLKVVHADARTVDWPDGNLFVFMYSPFRGRIFEEVGERLAAVAREPGRAVVIAYSADWEAAVLERLGCFTRVRLRRLQFWARSTVSLFYNRRAMGLRRGTGGQA